MSERPNFMRIKIPNSCYTVNTKNFYKLSVPEDPKPRYTTAQGPGEPGYSQKHLDCFLNRHRQAIIINRTQAGIDL